MIDYIIAHNPDDRVLSRACEFLAMGELICLPTDTNWVVLADPYHKQAVEKIYRLRGENKSKHFSLLCDTISRATEVALISDSTFRLIKRAIPGHYTFIFEATLEIAKTLKASKADKEIGLRFVPCPYVTKLIERYDSPLLSTHVTHTMLEIEENSPIYSTLIEESHLAHQIKLIIDPGEFEFSGKSTVVSFLGGPPEILRAGAGDVSAFSKG